MEKLKYIIITILLFFVVSLYYTNESQTEQYKEKIKLSQWQIKNLSEENESLSFYIWQDSLKIAQQDSIIRLYKNNLLKIIYDYETKTNNYLNDSLDERIRIFSRVATDQ